MTDFHDKIGFGLTTLASAATSATGAVLTEGEAKWVFITFTASFLLSGFLALIFKKSDETIRLVIGRCGFAIMGGILATKPVIHYFSLEEATSRDMIALAGVSSVVCGFFFIFGFALLKILENRAPSIADKWFKKVTK